MSAARYVGLDMGGTSVRAGLLDDSGSLIQQRKAPIEAQQGPAAGINRIIRLIEDLLDDNQGPTLAGIGIGATGPLDTRRGIIQNPYTLPGWGHVPITGPLETRFGVPAVLENDADAAALGEYWQGAGKGVERLFMVTLGTGIGTAFLYRGEVYRGARGVHPEGGHLPVDPAGPACYCGLYGCWEVLAAGPAVARRAKEAAIVNPGSLLLELSQGDRERIDARLLVQAVRQGDRTAQEVMQDVARDFARGLANIIIIFLPEMIVLSGGLMENVDLFLPTIREQVQAIEPMTPAGFVQIVPARLGDQAGMFGAAYAAIRRALD